MINIPFLGGDASSSSSSDDGRLAGFMSANGLLIAAVLVVLALVLGGALGVPAGMGVQLVVALELLAVYLVMHELDAYTFEGFVVVGAITTVVGLSATGEPVIASILNSGPGLLLVAGVLYVLYKRSQTERPKIVLRRGGEK